MTLTPAYGRDYKSKAEVLKAWDEGKDFVIADMFHPDSGRFCNKQDVQESVNIRYKGLRQVCVIPYRPQGQSRVR